MHYLEVLGIGVCWGKRNTTLTSNKENFGMEKDLSIAGSCHFDRLLGKQKTRTPDWQMLVWMWGEGNIYSPLVGMQSGLATIEIGVESPQKC